MMITLGIKWVTKRYEGAHKHVFPVFILFFGFVLTHENTYFKHFKIFEIWLVFYFFWTLIWITIWFDWKRIVLSFWIVKFYYIAIMYITYKELTFQFYFGIWYACISYPIVSILITKRILDLLKSVQENK